MLPGVTSKQLFNNCVESQISPAVNTRLGCQGLWVPDAGVEDEGAVCAWPRRGSSSGACRTGTSGCRNRGMVGLWRVVVTVAMYSRARGSTPAPDTVLAVAATVLVQWATPASAAILALVETAQFLQFGNEHGSHADQQTRVQAVGLGQMPQGAPELAGLASRPPPRAGPRPARPPPAALPGPLGCLHHDAVGGQGDQALAHSASIPALVVGHVLPGLGLPTHTSSRSLVTLMPTCVLTMAYSSCMLPVQTLRRPGLASSDFSFHTFGCKRMRPGIIASQSTSRTGPVSGGRSRASRCRIGSRGK